MEIQYVLILGIAIFLVTLLLFPIFLGILGRSIVNKRDWEMKNQESQENKTQFAVLQSEIKAKIEEERNRVAQIQALMGEIGQLRGESERDKSARELYAFQNQEFKEKIEQLNRDLNLEKQSSQKLQIELERLKEFMRSENEKYLYQKQELDKMSEKFESSFRNLANSILEERTQKFDLHQQTSLKHILEPLQKDIETFKKDFTDKFQFETTQRIGLGSQIENLMKMSNRLSEEANHLT